MNKCQWSEIEGVGDQVLKELEPIGTPHLIVDLSELDYIGSSMVALVVRVWKVVKAKQARMVVVNRNPMVLEVLQISKLNEVWPILEYREDALYELGVSQEAKTERRESNVLVMVCAFTAFASAGGLGLHLARPGLLHFPLLQIFAFGCSAIGAVLGLLLLVKGEGGRRAVGIAGAVLSLAVLIGAICLVPMADKPDNQAGNKSQVPKKAQSGEEGTKPSTGTDSTKIPPPAIAEKPPVPAEE
jgi:anti-anti-sigma factor